MPPPLILDPAQLDQAHPLVDLEGVQGVNPHRFEFQLLDAVLMFDPERRLFAGYHDIRADAWWTRAHIPGRPLFPGVLMIEVASQLSSFAFKRFNPTASFIGFVGVDGVKFRGSVVPPCRFVVVGRAVEVKARRMISEMQGFVDGSMVFEGKITGMPI